MIHKHKYKLVESKFRDIDLGHPRNFLTFVCECNHKHLYHKRTFYKGLKRGYMRGLWLMRGHPMYPYWLANRVPDDSN